MNYSPMKADRFRIVLASNVWISAAEAPYLVSGDQHLLSVVPLSILSIVSPADALVKTDLWTIQ
jgi:predicted nucleic acid-binding protein